LESFVAYNSLASFEHGFTNLHGPPKSHVAKDRNVELHPGYWQYALTEDFSLLAGFEGEDYRRIIKLAFLSS